MGQPFTGRKITKSNRLMKVVNTSPTNQKFEIVEIQEGIYAIKTRVTNSASCLDVYNRSTESGGNIAQWTYWGGACQRWYLEKAE